MIKWSFRYYFNSYTNSFLSFLNRCSICGARNVGDVFITSFYHGCGFKSFEACTIRIALTPQIETVFSTGICIIKCELKRPSSSTWPSGWRLHESTCAHLFNKVNIWTLNKFIVIYYDIPTSTTSKWPDKITS